MQSNKRELADNLAIKQTGSIIGRVGLYIGLCIWAFLQVFPLYWMFTFSLKDNFEIFHENPIGLPLVWRWENYSDVIENANMLTYFLNSVIVSVATIMVVIVFGLMATFALARMVWRGKDIANKFFMLGLAIPIHAALLPIFIVLRDLNLLNTHFALIIPYSAFAISMGILIFTGFISGIPKELEESACIDGCSIYGIFFRIIIPLMAPAVSVVTIFTYIQCWNELLFANTYVTAPQLRTLTAGIMALQGQYRTEWGPIGAGLTIATVPTLIIYFILSDKVQKSLVLGAIKG